VSRMPAHDQARCVEILNELPSIYQAVGSTGTRLRRTKPGTKRHERYMAALLRLESSASALQDELRFLLRFGSR